MIEVSLRGDGRVLRLTPMNARETFFEGPPTSVRERLFLELPRERWRACGKGLLDHLFRRCDHEDLSTDEISWLALGLNRLVAQRQFRLFLGEGPIQKIEGPPKDKGLYTQRCGVIFFLSLLKREQLALQEPMAIVQETPERDTSFLWFRELTSFRGELIFRCENFFDRSIDASVSLSTMQENTRRLFAITKTSPTEKIALTPNSLRERDNILDRH